MVMLETVVTLHTYILSIIWNWNTCLISLNNIQRNIKSLNFSDSFPLKRLTIFQLDLQLDLKWYIFKRPNQKRQNKSTFLKDWVTKTWFPLRRPLIGVYNSQLIHYLAWTIIFMSILRLFLVLVCSHLNAIRGN